MKLRINGNSIRLRLSRSEVAHFDTTGHIEDVIDFGPLSKFRYSMTAVEDSTLSSIYNDGDIQVRVPRQLARDWVQTDRVSLSAEQVLENDNTLQILVEKDFQCIHKSSDANADSYPNPLASQGSTD